MPFDILNRRPTNILYSSVKTCFHYVSTSRTHHYILRNAICVFPLCNSRANYQHSTNYRHTLFNQCSGDSRSCSNSLNNFYFPFGTSDFPSRLKHYIFPCFRIPFIDRCRTIAHHPIKSLNIGVVSIFDVLDELLGNFSLVFSRQVGNAVWCMFLRKLGPFSCNFSVVVAVLIVAMSVGFNSCSIFIINIIKNRFCIRT